MNWSRDRVKKWTLWTGLGWYPLANGVRPRAVRANAADLLPKSDHHSGKWPILVQNKTVLSGNEPKWGQYPVGVFPGCNTKTLRIIPLGVPTKIRGTQTKPRGSHAEGHISLKSLDLQRGGPLRWGTLFQRVQSWSFVSQRSGLEGPWKVVGVLYCWFLVVPLGYPGVFLWFPIVFCCPGWFSLHLPSNAITGVFNLRAAVACSTTWGGVMGRFKPLKMNLGKRTSTLLLICQEGEAL